MNISISYFPKCDEFSFPFSLIISTSLQKLDVEIRNNTKITNNNFKFFIILNVLVNNKIKLYKKTIGQ